MRTAAIIIVSIGLGIVLGVGTSWAHLNWGTKVDRLVAAMSGASAAEGKVANSGPPPKVVVESEEFAFGRVAVGTTVKHSFHLANDGAGPLVLESGGTSCSRCTLSSVPERPIPPGGGADVEVQYHAHTGTEGEFRQTAVVKTNDPERPEVDLVVSGKVTVPVSVNPPDIVFSHLGINETRSATIKILAHLDADFKIESFELSDRDTAPYYDIAIEPLSAAELEAGEAKSGCQLKVTIRPGMPLGPVRQFLTLHTNLPDQREMVISIEGSVESEVSVAGPNFNREEALLTLPVVGGRKGIERKLLVLVRGEHRHEIKVSLVECTPPLVASLGEPADLASGAVVQIPLIIKIPPGTPPVDHTQDYGKIVLETNHPEAEKIIVRVSFAVQDK